MYRRIVLTAALLLTSCADTLKTSQDKVEDTTSDDEIKELGGPNIKITNNGNNTLHVVVDATSESEWIYFDLDTLTQVFPAATSGIAIAHEGAHAEHRVWDLAFQRFKIGANGGVSGAGGVKISVLEADDFLARTEAPANSTSYEDKADGSDEDSDPDLVFLKYPANEGNEGWYDYNTQTHVLTARDVVYVPVSTLGAPYKIKIAKYYNAAGTSGHLSFDLAGLFDGWSADGVKDKTGDDDEDDSGDDGSDDGNGTVNPVNFAANGDGTFTVKVDASDHNAWIYVDFETRTQVTPGTPTDSTAWDLAFRRTEVKVNNGLSGTGDVDVAALTGASFSAVSAAPERFSTPYYIDGDKEGDGTIEYAFKTFPAATSPGDYGWFNYNFATHEITVRDVVYVFRSRSGAYHRLKIQNYYNDANVSGNLTLQFGSVSAPDDDAQGCYDTGAYTKSTVYPGAVTVNASDSASWVYFDLESGLQVYPCDATNSTIWDLAYQRTKIKVNGGANGAGDVALAAIKGDDFDLRTAAPATTYATDASASTLAFSTYPAADVVGKDFGWYNYAGAPTHLITARDIVYAIRSAQGNYFKLKLTNYYQSSLSGYPQFKYAVIDP